MNTNNIHVTLLRGLQTFENHMAGTLISFGKSLAVIKHDAAYYFTDSHSCGPKGAMVERALFNVQRRLSLPGPPGRRELEMFLHEGQHFGPIGSRAFIWSSIS